MSWAAAIVLIVLIGAAASVLRSRNNARNGITEDMMGNQTITHRPDPTPQADEEAQREIAELKEIPLGTVEGRIRIGMAKLRSLLLDLGVGGSRYEPR